MSQPQSVGELLALIESRLKARTEAQLAAFVADWPARDDAAVAKVAPAPLPVLRWLRRAGGDARGAEAGLVRAICHLAASLAWRQTYRAGEVADRFLENYGYCELLGPRGPANCAKIACGVLLLGPDTLYPPHRHPAEEMYLVLSGAADWRQGSAPWRRRAPGTLIHHRSEELHAMKTAADPLLALYLWRGGDLSRAAQLEPAEPA